MIEEFATRRLRRYTETSLSHWQCRWVIDEKISDRIVVLSLRVVTTVLEEVVTRRSRWYTERAWAHLLYLTSSHSSIYVKNRELKKTIRTHSLSLIKVTIHSTSTWHKLNQEKERVTQYNHTLSSHCVHLSFITYFSAQWMTIIEQENAALRMLQSRASRVQRKRLSSLNQESNQNIVV